MNFLILRFQLVINILLLMIVMSCYSYRNIVISKKIDAPSKTFLLQLDNKAIFYSDDWRYFSQKKFYGIDIKKYLSIISSSGPVAIINNKAVELIENKKYMQAEILFNEVIKENPDEGSAYNNLGVIYEVFGDINKAFDMYFKACMIAPENSFFKKNLSTFMDNKKMMLER